MRQLMREKEAPCRRAGREALGRYKDVRADGVCRRIQRPCARPGFSIGVNPHAAEIVAEPPLEQIERRPVEWLSGRPGGRPG